MKREESVYHICVDRGTKEYYSYSIFRETKSDVKLIGLNKVDTIDSLVNDLLYKYYINMNECIFYLDTHGFGIYTKDQLLKIDKTINIHEYMFKNIVSDKIFIDLDASILRNIYSEYLDEDSSYNFAIALREINGMKPYQYISGIRYKFENGNNFAEVLLVPFLYRIFK